MVRWQHNSLQAIHFFRNPWIVYSWCCCCKSFSLLQNPSPDEAPIFSTSPPSLLHRMSQMWLEGAERSCSFLAFLCGVRWCQNCDTLANFPKNATRTRVMNILVCYTQYHTLRVFTFCTNYSGDTEIVWRRTSWWVGTTSSTAIVRFIPGLNLHWKQVDPSRVSLNPETRKTVELTLPSESYS